MRDIVPTCRLILVVLKGNLKSLHLVYRPQMKISPTLESSLS
jgi:hypothetical protein